MELITAKEVEASIHNIRDTQVILDKDLALFYEVKPIRLREQVKRNAQRFPSDFVFQLTDEEVEMLVSQNAIPSKQSLGGYLPYVFTEQGVAAVSGVLKTDKAAEVSVLIMRTFVAMRKFLLQNSSVFQRLDRLEKKQLQTDQKLELVFNALEKEIVPKQGIFFEGQLFDAHVFVSNLIKEASKSIVVVDNYANENTLLLLSKRKTKVSCEVHTRVTPELKADLAKHNKQYPEIVLRENKGAHDRFLILDQKRLFHFGASLKDLGNKCFAFSQMDELLPLLIENLLKHGK